MSGHNKWSTIKHKKAATDAKRGKIFTKILRELTVSVKENGQDPDTNAGLRTILAKAKAVNMPKDTIDKAIQKAAGASDGADYTECVYEGYGPNSVALIVKTLTDNKNRTAAEMRYLFSRSNGNLGESGSVAWIFELKGVISVDASAIAEEKLMDLVLEAGADDMTKEDDYFEIETAPTAYQGVVDALTQAGIKLESSEISRIPKNTVKLDEEQATKVMKLINALEDNDDVQDVYHNMEVDDEIMDRIANQ